MLRYGIGQIAALGCKSGIFRSQRSCRAWFVQCAGVVVVGCCIKSEVERCNLFGKPDNDLHGEVVRHFNTCSLGENPPKHSDVIVRLLFVV